MKYFEVNVTIFSGIKVMFKVALALFRHTLGKQEILAECPTLYKTMERLWHIPPEIMEEEFISREVYIQWHLQWYNKALTLEVEESVLISKTFVVVYQIEVEESVLISKTSVVVYQIVVFLFFFFFKLMNLGTVTFNFF